MKRIDRTNEENTSKYGHMVIIKYINSKDIDVKFDNGYIALHQTYRNFINGSIINPMTPTVLGKGYYGVGKYVAKINGKHTKEYKVWRAMLNRCYGKLYQESHKTYENCEVCDEWLNFQVFAEWFHENYYEINGEIIDLDKDFLSGKTKIYSPQTCVFIPQSINKTIIHTRNKHSGLPTGVIHANDNANVYVVKYREDNKDVFVGRFHSVEDAYKAYLCAKNNRLKDLLNEYKEYMPNNVCDAIENYINTNKIKAACEAA